ncbi:MAG TPA: hypothetical protein VGV14_16375 [Rhodanobacter sp.]|nr:hypothetical protein [Rhodanobacter sp.]
MNAPAEAVPAVLQGHFKGIAVVIDDQVHVEEAIKEIVDAIETAGGHAIRMTELPSDQADLENLTGAAFFILDWNLVELGEGVQPPEGFAAAEVERKIAFLRRLREHRHAPIFIFTKENPEVVKDALRPHEDIYQEGSSNILIRQKADVGKDVYRVLNDWAESLPSVLALKSWERANGKAVNSVFIDLHDRDHLWPVFMWKMFKDDNLVAPDELGRLINRLVASRMSPPAIDLDAFLENLDAQHAADPEKYHRALLAVMEGERFLRNGRLDQNSYSTGDVFQDTNAQGKVTYLINLRAECDCIKHPGRTPGKMHLLGGREDPTVLEGIDPTYGLVHEQDNEGIVVAMFEGKNIRFGFANDLKVQEWNATWKAKRIGRLLPPFLTRLLERYASYAHRPGIPRVPSALVPTRAPVTEAHVPDLPDGIAAATSKAAQSTAS